MHRVLDKLIRVGGGDGPGSASARPWYCWRVARLCFHSFSGEGKAKNALMAVSRESKPYMENITRFANGGATKGGLEIGEAGIAAIYDVLLKMFEEQPVRPVPKVTAKEDPKEDEEV